MPISPVRECLHPHQVNTKNDLSRQRDAIRRARAEELRLRGRPGVAVAEEEVGEAVKVRRQQKHTEQDEVERDLFQTDVVRHVKDEDFGHRRQADRCAQHRGAWNEQQNSAQHFRATREDFVHRSGANRRPQEVAERQVAKPR